MNYKILMFNKFYNDDKAVSNVIGTVLLLAIFMILIATIQSTMVPQWNRETELSHRENIIEDLFIFRSAIQDVAIDGIPRNRILSLGTRYPNKIIFINSGPGVQGNLKFEPMNVTIKITNNTNPPIIKNFQSNRIIYTSNGLLNLPNIISEHGIIITDFGHRNTTSDKQSLIINNKIFIPIVVGNMNTVSSMGIESFNIMPLGYKNIYNVTSIDITMDIHNVTVWEDVINNSSHITFPNNKLNISISNLDNVTIQVPLINNNSTNVIYSGIIKIN